MMLLTRKIVQTYPKPIQDDFYYQPVRVNDRSMVFRRSVSLTWKSRLAAVIVFALPSLLLAVDSDSDGLDDSVETNTGIYISPTNTGTNSNNSDSDADGAGDWYEITASFTDPNSKTSKPKIPYPLPDPDSSIGLSNKSVKVYIMSGQSNMVGDGLVAGTALGTLDTITKQQNKFPNLLNSSNGWTKRSDVIYRSVITDPWTGDGKLTVADAGSSIGPEFGFGHVMGYYLDEPVLLIKSSQGNRALGWDYRPPGSPRFDYTDGYTYSAYGESPERWLTGTPGPTPFVWYSGKQYDDCFLAESEMGTPAWAVTAIYPANCQVRHNGVIYLSKSAHTSAANTEPGVGAQWDTYWSVYSIFNVVDILDNFATEYPSWAAQGFEIAGFVWWQGNRDFADGVNFRLPYPIHYEPNLVQFIKQLRAYYTNRYPGKCSITTPFVLATGCGDPQTSGNGLVVANAQLAVSDPAKYPEFAGNVKTMDTRNYWRERSVSPANNVSHYHRNAETYMLNGDALGRGMIELEERASYAAWQSANNTASALDQDHDNDGVLNGIEWFINGSNESNGHTTLPSVTGSGDTLSITWTKAATYIGIYGSSFVVETCETLIGTWTPEALSSNGPVSVNGNDVTFTFPLPMSTRNFVRLRVIEP
jgi:hypothetical protein